MISNRQFEYKIKEALRHSPESAFLSSEACEARRIAFLKKMGVDESARPVYSFHDYFQYYSWNFTHGFLLPAAAGFAMVLFVIGGWMTAATAAEGALPGDPLYGVKLATEKVQLGLAFSPQKRAELHMAFASRRLSEMAVLSKMQQSDSNDELVAVAVDGFKSQVTGATSALQSLPNHSDEAVSVARSVETKTQEYKQVIHASEVDEASNAAVDVIMSTAEQSSEDSAAVAQAHATFAERKAAIDSRMKFLIGRVAVLRETNPSNDELDSMTESLLSDTDKLNKADALAATGAFRTSFDMLTSIETELDTIEAAVHTQETPTL